MSNNVNGINSFICTESKTVTFTLAPCVYPQERVGCFKDTDSAGGALLYGTTYTQIQGLQAVTPATCRAFAANKKVPYYALTYSERPRPTRAPLPVGNWRAPCRG